MSIWVKICANTSLKDALLAAQAGADAVGFVFAPSSRRVMVEQVAAIVPGLPETLEKIGVFAEARFEEIAETIQVCGLSGVQLHFDAPPELPVALRARFGMYLRIVRTIHFAAGSGNLPQQQATLAPDPCLLDPNIDAILVDSRTATATGGTGQTFDWNLAATTLFQSAEAHKRPLIAAGGLTPENVAEAIRILNPWGVDVASGVEAAPGSKDPAKVRAFIANARAARRG